MTEPETRYYALLTRDLGRIATVYASTQEPRNAAGVPDDLLSEAHRYGERFVLLDLAPAEDPENLEGCRVKVDPEEGVAEVVAPYSDCVVVWSSDDDGGWFLRYTDEHGQRLDWILTTTDRADVDGALDEAVRWMGRDDPGRDTIAVEREEETQESIDARLYVRDGVVVDPTGGVWGPSPEAAEEIANSTDPAATALRICREDPMRGEWSQ